MSAFDPLRTLAYLLLIAPQDSPAKGTGVVPWLPLYLYGNDPNELLATLNSDHESAFIVADGSSRWRAVATLSTLPKGRHAIWHVPSGALPLLHPATAQPSQTWISDPWSGWQERESGFDAGTPYFGAGHHGIVWLNLENEAGGSEQQIGLSSLEWIGHRYDALGAKASAETDRWWKRLGATVTQKAKKVPRGGPSASTKAEIYALPDAIDALERGVSANINP